MALATSARRGLWVIWVMWRPCSVGHMGLAWASGCMAGLVWDQAIAPDDPDVWQARTCGSHGACQMSAHVEAHMGRLACGLTGLHGYGVWPCGVWLLLGRIWLLGMYGLSGCPPMHPDVWAIHTKPY